MTSGTALDRARVSIARRGFAVDNGIRLRFGWVLAVVGLAVWSLAGGALVGCGSESAGGEDAVKVGPGFFLPDTGGSGSADGQAGGDGDGALDGSDPAGADASGDSLGSDAGGADGTGDGEAADGGHPFGDTSNDVVSSGSSPIGGPCTTDSDCAAAGATCTLWPEGKSFCTVFGCELDTSCPAGSACIPLVTSGEAVTWGCAPTCDSPLDCRPGYGCKVVPVPGAPLLRVCHAVQPSAGGPASFCDSHADCAKDASCLKSFPKGYCAQFDCGPARPCTAGTKCVALEGLPNACLATCDPSHPCPGSLAHLQECVPLVDITGLTVDVCAKGSTGKDLGDFCEADDECLSGLCELVATGICLEGGLPCLTNDDCGPGGSCEQGPSYAKRVCGQACTAEQPCDDGSVCVPQSASEGRCRAACLGLADVLSCDGALAERCVFGLPFDSEPGQGAYACMRIPPGAAGTPCDTASPTSCAEGLTCVQGAPGKEGMCVAGCGGPLPNDVSFCPWTTVCANTGAFTGCHKLCPEKQTNCIPGFPCECPLGYACTHTLFAAPFEIDLCADTSP